MMLRIPILAGVLLLALTSVVRAQTPCGIVRVDGPTEVDPGTALVFNATIKGLSHTTNIEIKWKLSAGTIMAGQGTDTISVDTAGLGGVDVIATAELSGAPVGCERSGSKTTRVKSLIVCGLPLDQYGDIKFSDEKARLDNFAIQLLNEPLSTGYILMSAGQETFKGEAAQRLARAKAYLVKVRRTDPTRVITVDCGYTQDLTVTLTIALPAAAPPPCIKVSTISLSEVKFTKPRPKTSKKRR